MLNALMNYIVVEIEGMSREVKGSPADLSPTNASKRNSRHTPNSRVKSGQVGK